MNLKNELDKFAKKLADKAVKDATSLQESIDAFKALTAYYAAQQKTRRNQSDDDEQSDGFSFQNNEVVNGSPGQRAKVRAS